VIVESSTYLEDEETVHAHGKKLGKKSQSRKVRSRSSSRTRANDDAEQSTTAAEDGQITSSTFDVEVGQKLQSKKDKHASRKKKGHAEPAADDGQTWPLETDTQIYLEEQQIDEENTGVVDISHEIDKKSPKKRRADLGTPNNLLIVKSNRQISTKASMQLAISKRLIIKTLQIMTTVKCL
jgi:hypothetical protein